MINTIISFIGVLATIFVPILVSYITAWRMRDESCFYSYITLSDEKFIRKTKIKSIILLLIIICVNIVGIINSVFHFFSISRDVAIKTQVVGMTVIMVTAFCLVFCGSIMSFSNNKFFDSILKKSNRNYDRIGRSIDTIVIAICSVFFIIYLLIGNNNDVIIVVAYAFFLVSLGIDASLNYYVYMYIKIRRWFYVDKISIRTKHNGKVYRNIYNYKRDNNSYSFVLEIDKKPIRVEVPIDEVVSIEYEIDKKTTFLDNWNNNNLDISKQK